MIILTHLENRCATLTLNRPEKRNAFSPEFVAELVLELNRAIENPNVKVILIKANGPVFSAGADLDYLQQLQQNTYEQNLQDSQNLALLYSTIYHSPKVVVAQIQGSAIAGGCGLASVCDLSYATPDAQFAYTEVKIGFIPAIVSIFLLRKIGETKARELLLTGKLIDAATAQNYGLITGILNPETIESEVEKIIQNLCTQTSQSSLALTKKLIAGVQDRTYQDALDYAAALNATTRATPDCKAGIAAFLNKQKLEW